jgi:hypothetical protein
MINFIKKIFKLNEKEGIINQEPSAEEKRQEYSDLLRISIGNVSYIKAYSNVLKSISATAKGASASETRKKREWAKRKLEWLSSKLKEEEVMVIEYSKILKSYS